MKALLIIAAAVVAVGVLSQPPAPPSPTVDVDALMAEVNACNAKLTTLEKICQSVPKQIDGHDAKLHELETKLAQPVEHSVLPADQQQSKFRQDYPVIADQLAQHEYDLAMLNKTLIEQAGKIDEIANRPQVCEPPKVKDGMKWEMWAQCPNCSFGFMSSETGRITCPQCKRVFEWYGFNKKQPPPGLLPKVEPKTDFDQAVADAEAAGKTEVAFFLTRPTCGPCLFLRDTVLNQPAFQQRVVTRYVWREITPELDSHFPADVRTPKVVVYNVKTKTFGPYVTPIPRTPALLQQLGL